MTECRCTPYYTDPDCQRAKDFAAQAAPETENQRHLWGTCPVCGAGHGEGCSPMTRDGARTPGLVSSAEAFSSLTSALLWHPERVAAAPPIAKPSAQGGAK